MPAQTSVQNQPITVIEEKKKSPFIYIASLLLVAILFTLIGVISYRFLGKKSQESVSSICPECIDKKCPICPEVNNGTTDEKKYWTYQTYKDDWVKFDYPAGWTATAGSGHIVDTGAGIDFTGLNSIELKSPQSEYRLQIIYMYGGTGGDFYEYDLNNPLILKYTPEDFSSQSGQQTIQLKNKLLLHNVPYSDFVLAGLLEKLAGNNGESISSYLIGTVTDSVFTSSNAPMIFSYKFLGGTGTTGIGQSAMPQNKDGSTLLACPMKTETDFKKCAEFLDTFFGTVKRLKWE